MERGSAIRVVEGPYQREASLRNADSFEQSWIRGFFIRTVTISVALACHLTLLFALEYSWTDKSVVRETAGEISIDIVTNLPDHLASAPSRDALSEETEAKFQVRADPPPSETIDPTSLLPAPSPRDIASIARLPDQKSSAKKMTAARQPSVPARPGALPQMAALSTTAGETSPAAVGTADTPAGEGLALSSDWKLKLAAHLDRHKRYPEAARARRAQGTAFISFGISRDGRVLRYQLVRSSGHAELDEEVLALIVRASPLPSAPPEIREEIVQLVVPVRFKI